jgi:optic atrophy protein 1
MLVGRVLRGALKLRYLLLGAGVGGTVTLNKVSKIFYFNR